MKLRNFIQYAKDASTETILDTLEKIKLNGISARRSYLEVLYEELNCRKLSELEQERFIQLTEFKEETGTKNKSTLLYDTLLQKENNNGFAYFCANSLTTVAILLIVIGIPFLFSSTNNGAQVFANLISILVFSLILFSLSQMLRLLIKSSAK